MIPYELRDTILYLDNVELGYGTNGDYKCVLKDVNLTEADVVREGHITGQTIAIVGRSGRGKSTLFKALTGLVTPKEGQVLITELETEDGSDAKHVKEGDIGFVDQKYTLFRNKTVYEILMDAQRNRGEKVHLPLLGEVPPTLTVPRLLMSLVTLKIGKYWKACKEEKANRKEKVEKYLETWGLEGQKAQYPCELSGGQRQRTAIIEQILSSGHFMVLDEPFSGLDVGNIISCKNAFELIRNDHELNTIIYSTHDMKLAVELADSIYVVGHKEGYEDCSTIVKHFDLKAMGLAWKEFGPEHHAFVEELTQVLINS